MENKINVAELLRNCPKGMELDCTMFDRVTFDEVTTVIGFDDKKRVKIILSTHYSDGTKDEINLTEYGTYTYDETAKCVIFPKGKTTWEGFQIPFKDGDMVQFKKATSCGFIYEIIEMEWKNDRVEYTISVMGTPYKDRCFSEDLQLYKAQETIEEIIKIDIPKGYEFAGVDDDNQKVIFEKIGCQYPKTYCQCCDVLKIEYPLFKTEEDGISASTYKNKLFGALKQLIICRDAYWKLSEWNPKIKGERFYMNSLPSFLKDIFPMPTEETRYAFYKNFKDLIEQCKELL